LNLPGDVAQQQFAVVVAVKIDAFRFQLAPHLVVVYDVAIAGQRVRRAKKCFQQVGLGIELSGAALGGIAHMPDGDTAWKQVKLFISKHFFYQAHFLAQPDHLAIADSHTAAFLAAMLFGKHAQCGQ